MTVAHKNAGLNIIADRRLAFDLRLRPFGDRHLSGLLPSPVATSDSRSGCLSSSLNPDVGSRIAAVWCSLVDESYQIVP